MTHPTFTEHGDKWALPLAGELVTRCSYDYQFTLLVGEVEPSFTVTIEEAFTVRWADGSTNQFTPGGDPLKMGETLGFVRRRIRRAHAFKDGRLEIDFEGGILLRVPGGHGYEPWNVHGPGGMLMVSGTDGELIIWD